MARELEDPAGEHGDEGRLDSRVPRQRCRHLLRQFLPVRLRRLLLLPPYVFLNSLLLLYGRRRWRCPNRGDGGGSFAPLADVVLGDGLAAILVVLVHAHRHSIVLDAALHLLLHRAYAYTPYI